MQIRKMLFLAILALLINKAAHAAFGLATIVSTSSNSVVSGTVDLEDTKAGLKISAHIQNATPGNHGFHIHEFGSCADNGKAAGSHYNPKGVKHGNIVKDGPTHAHEGDLGNFIIGSDGTGHLEATISGLTLIDGPLNVAGRAFVFHEKEDDFGQPVGNAGARPGCGSIVLVGKK